MFLVANARYFGGRVAYRLLFSRNLFIHGRDAAVHDLFLFLDAFVLIHSHDFVCDIGGLLGVGIENADLKQIGIAHFFDIESAEEELISLLSRGPT